MYFSGVNVSVYLTKPPKLKYKALVGSEIRTLPATGHFVKTNITFPWVTYQDYKTGAVKHETTGTTPSASIGVQSTPTTSASGLMAIAEEEAWPIEDYKALWQFGQDLMNMEVDGDKRSNYTTDGSLPLDAIAIQFSAEQEATPIFSPYFEYYETAMKSSSLVQGAITLNYDESLERELLGTSNKMDLIILYKTDKEVSKERTGYYEELDPPPPGPYTSYLIRDVHFISRSHAVQPTADAISETYQFIARNIE